MCASSFDFDLAPERAATNLPKAGTCLGPWSCLRLSGVGHVFVPIRSPAVADARWRRCLRALAEKLTAAERMVAALTSSDVGARVAAYLLDLPATWDDGRARVRLPLPKNQLAGYLGTTPRRSAVAWHPSRATGWSRSAGPRGADPGSGRAGVARRGLIKARGDLIWIKARRLASSYGAVVTDSCH